MMNGISSSSSYFAQMQMKGPQGGQGNQRMGQKDQFAQLDVDGNGGIDQSELQALADKVAQTGQSLNVEEAAATYDANQDGLLDRDEAQSMMIEIQSKVGGNKGGKGSGGMSSVSQQSLSAYLTETEEETTSTLMEMFGQQAENKSKYTPLDLEV